MNKMKKSFDNVRHTFGMMVWSWRHIKPWRIRFILCAIFGTMQNAWISLVSAYLIGQATAHAVTGNFRAMLSSTGFAALITLVGVIVVTFVYYNTSKINILGLSQLRKTLFSKLNSMPSSKTSSLLSGDLSTRLSMDAERTASFFSPMVIGAHSIFSYSVGIIISMAICIVMLPALGIPCLIFLFISIIMNLDCIRREYALHTQRMNVHSKLTQHIANIISGSVIMRVFGLTRQRQALYEEDAGTAFTYAMRGARFNAARSSLSNAVQWGAIIFSLILGSYYVHLGTASLETVVFIVVIQSQVNNEVLMMLNSYHNLQYATVSATRVKEILDFPDEVTRTDSKLPDMDAVNAVHADCITALYAENSPVLEDFSLSVKNGEKLAIVGGSGGGKTTLIKSIMEFVETSGAIDLFGHPIERYSQTTVRNLIAYVPQDCYLFDATIRENIAWGNTDASEEDILNAAYNAGLRELIESLPDGIDTRVGDKSVLLSGGQRQRIAIARAMVKNAPLLLLDEATSALDGESEQAVQQAMDKLMEGRTAIIIAHRLSTVQNADRIIVIENGELIEEGLHNELIAKDGRYAQLYRMQFASS